ncbi:MAG TPA: right-handed parallel beta-helix repeat-containing protein, partial [Polyangiaceae bacterium]
MRSLLRSASLLALAVTAGCGSSSSSNGAAPSADAGPPLACPDGFAADDANVGCVDVTPADDCPAGTRATLGSTDCKPVAAIECKDGFVADSSGWGCRDVQPDVACTGAAREALGQTSCVPIGDCGAAFPPATATIFVGPTVTPDATHFTTIQAALDAAPAEALVAVDSGTYTEALTVTKTVGIVGRCAAMVTLASPDGTAPGITTSGAPGWTASGLTIRGGDVGVNVGGGNATLDSIVVEGASGAGIRAKGGTASLRNGRIHGISNDGGGTGFGVDASNGTVTITDSAIVFAATAGINTTGNGKVTLTHSIVRDTDGGGGTDGQGVGAACSAGGQLDVEQSAFVGNHVAAIVVLDKGSSVGVYQSVLRGSIAVSNGYGDGLVVMAGGDADLVQTTISENQEWGITSDGPSAKLTIDAVVVRGG